MKKYLNIVIVGLFVFSGVSIAGLDVIAWNGSEFATTNINSQNYTALVANTTTDNIMASKADGTIQWVTAPGGTWTTADATATSTGSGFKAFVPSGTTANQFFGVTTSGVDWVRYPWVSSEIHAGSYSALTPNSAASNSMFAAKNTGGIDWIRYGGGWVADAMPTSAVYTALAHDTASNICYAAGADGLDVIYYDGGAGAWAYYHINDTEYVDIAGDQVGSRRIYATRADGGIDVINGSSMTSWTSATYLSGQFFDTVVSATGANTLYALTADGDVVRGTYTGADIGISTIATGDYGLLLADSVNTNKVYAATIPEPATMSLLGVGVALTLIRKRK